MGLYLLGIFGSGIGLLDGGRGKSALRGRDTHKDRSTSQECRVVRQLTRAGVFRSVVTGSMTTIFMSVSLEPDLNTFSY